MLPPMLTTAGLYLMIYMGNAPGGFMGPIPDGNMNKCGDWVREIVRKQDTAIKTGLDLHGKPIAQRLIDRMKTITFACEVRMTKPAVIDLN